MPNIENLTKLKDWLDAGAPHVKFDMTHGICVPLEVTGEGDCGTACCIAGAAALMSMGYLNGGFKSKETRVYVHDFSAGVSHADIVDLNSAEVREANWFEVSQKAMDWLGLEIDPKWDRSQHPLFSNSLSPNGCTPAQAATAVQNVIDGREAWEGVA